MHLITVFFFQSEILMGIWKLRWVFLSCTDSSGLLKLSLFLISKRQIEKVKVGGVWRLFYCNKNYKSKRGLVFKVSLLSGKAF